jgi:uncharacterized protein YbaP (TraB family)
VSRRLALGLLLTLAVLPAQAATRPTSRPVGTRHPFLWQIDGKGDQTFEKKSWLYGTMHQGDGRLLALPDPVEQARRSADVLYCEVNMGQAQRNRKVVLRRMLLPQGQTLGDRLPTKLYQRLSDYLAKRDVQIRDIARLQVWAVPLWLDRINGEREGLTKRLDQMLYRDAKSAGKEVGGLETVNEQLGAHANVPEQDCIQMLSASLAYLEKLEAKGVEPTRMLLDAYLTGDEAKVMALMHDAFGKDAEMLEQFMKPGVKRNRRMADRMARMMEVCPERSYFFAVGLLHCPYENGIVEMLREKGYRIRRIGAPKKKRKRRWL